MNQFPKNIIDHETPAKPLRSADFCNKLSSLLTKLLATGNWDNSSFLKKAKLLMQDLLAEAQNSADQLSGSVIENTSMIIRKKQLETGLIRVYISLYQVEGTNFDLWLNTLRTLTMYNITRPTYRYEEYVRDLINSKTEQKRHGYAELLVNENDLIPINPLPVDTLGHELLILKEGAVQFDHIIKFVHANKKIYRVSQNKLDYESDIEN